jgi:hypothetical protein
MNLELAIVEQEDQNLIEYLSDRKEFSWSLNTENADLLKVLEEDICDYSVPLSE